MYYLRLDLSHATGEVRTLYFSFVKNHEPGDL